MSTAPIRYSPIHGWLKAHAAQWGPLGDASIALNFGDADSEQMAAKQLGLCDLSGLSKLGLKGPGAAARLQRHDVGIPGEMFATGPISGDGLIARLGAEEFFLEDGFGGTLVAELGKQLGSTEPGIYRVDRHDGTFLLCGTRAPEVFAQTCGLNVRELPTGRMVFTRAAGVNCMILPQPIGETIAYRLWVDPSFASDLWHSLYEITSELGGRVVGAASVTPSGR